MVSDLGLLGMVIFLVIILRTIFLSIIYHPSFKFKFPKFPTTSIKTKIIWFMAILTIYFIISGIFSVYVGLLNLTKDSFDDDSRYYYSGNFNFAKEGQFDNKVLKINGEAIVFNNKTSTSSPFGISYYKQPRFKILGKGFGKIKIVMDNGEQHFESEEFFVEGPFEIIFGTGGSYHLREDAVYLTVNSASLTADKEPIYLYTDCEYSVKIYFVGSFTVNKIVIGA